MSYFVYVLKNQKKTSFYCVFGPWNKKGVVFISFFCGLPARVAKTISFTVFSERETEKALVFIAVQQPKNTITKPG